MGCANSCENQNKKTSKEQINYLIDLEYSKKILYICLSSLKVIGTKFSFTPDTSSLIPNNEIDCSFKDLDQLKKQFELMVMLFELSKQKLADQKQKFTYSDEVPEKYIKSIIEEYKSYFRQFDEDIFRSLGVLQNIINGVHFIRRQYWMGSDQIQNPEKRINKKLLKEGIEATLMKDELEKIVREKYKCQNAQTENLS